MNTNNNSLSGTLNASERILILVGAETSASALFFQAKKVSDRSDTEWFALCVDPGGDALPACRSQFNENLTLAIQSGAKVIHLIDSDVFPEIVKLVSKYRIDRILIGNFRLGKLPAAHSSDNFKSLLHKHLDFVNITELAMEEEQPFKRAAKVKITTRPTEYLIAVFAMALTSVLCFLVKEIIGYQTVGLIFLILTAVLSLFVGRGAVIFTAFLNFAVWNFFFIPPILTFHVSSIHDSILLFANLAIAVSGGSLISRLRRNQADLEHSRQRITLLYSLLESLNNAKSIKEVVSKLREELDRHFEADAVIYLKEKKGNRLEKKAFGNTEFFNDKDFNNAGQYFESRDHEPLIHLSDTNKKLIQYFLLSGQRETLGVIGIVTEDNVPADGEKLLFLKSFISQVTSALEREISIDAAKEKQVYIESQKLFQTVLNSVSHELRTPVSIISSAISNLMDERTAADPENRRKICNELDSSANRLNLLIENILDMSKIESGYLKLNIQPYDLADLFGVVLNQLKEDLKSHEFKVEIPEILPLVYIDINWIKQALLNLFYNAIHYTPAGSRICLSVSLSERSVRISVNDNGPGVPESSLDLLFDKFYRVPGSQSGGTGLGLAIAKAIVEAHKGSIHAGNLKEGGLSVTIEIPIPK